MTKILFVDGEEIDPQTLTDHGKTTARSLEFADTRIKELENMRALLQRAKNSYIESLKLEVLKDKSGFLFDDT